MPPVPRETTVYIAAILPTDRSTARLVGPSFADRRPAGSGQGQTADAPESTVQGCGLTDDGPEAGWMLVEGGLRRQCIWIRYRRPQQTGKPSADAMRANWIFHSVDA